MRKDEPDPGLWCHSAEPIKEGDCCNHCWITKVMRKLVEDSAASSSAQSLLNTIDEYAKSWNLNQE